jgi:putative transcriptional regulator
MKLPDPNGLTGKLLIAAPKLQSDIFSQSVIYMVGHDKFGAVGIVINQLAPNVNIDDLYEDFHISKPDALTKHPIHFGGPVDVNMGLVIHSPTDEIKKAVRVGDSIYISACHDFLNQASMDKKPSDMLITLGYASWTGGQLEAEMMESDWLTVDASPDIIFEPENDQKWGQTLSRLKIDKTIHSHQVGLA